MNRGQINELIHYIIRDSNLVRYLKKFIQDFKEYKKFKSTLLSAGKDAELDNIIIDQVYNVYEQSFRSMEICKIAPTINICEGLISREEFGYNLSKFIDKRLRMDLPISMPLPIKNAIENTFEYDRNTLLSARGSEAIDRMCGLDSVVFESVRTYRGGDMVQYNTRLYCSYNLRKIISKDHSAIDFTLGKFVGEIMSNLPELYDKAETGLITSVSTDIMTSIIMFLIFALITVFTAVKRSETRRVTGVQRTQRAQRALDGIRRSSRRKSTRRRTSRRKSTRRRTSRRKSTRRRTSRRKSTRS